LGSKKGTKAWERQRWFKSRKEKKNSAAKSGGTPHKGKMLSEKRNAYREKRKKHAASQLAWEIEGQKLVRSNLGREDLPGGWLERLGKEREERKISAWQKGKKKKTEMGTSGVIGDWGKRRRRIGSGDGWVPVGGENGEYHQTSRKLARTKLTQD